MNSDSRETVNLNEEEDGEGNDSVSQLTGLESVRQSIPPLSYRLVSPALTALSITGSNTLLTVLNYFND